MATKTTQDVNRKSRIKLNVIITTLSAVIVVIFGLPGFIKELNEKANITQQCGKYLTFDNFEGKTSIFLPFTFINEGNKIGLVEKIESVLIDSVTHESFYFIATHTIEDDKPVPFNVFALAKDESKSYVVMFVPQSVEKLKLLP